jgi:dihydrosphingosine 1-phosphate phosphatase
VNADNSADCIAGIFIGTLLWWVKMMYGEQLDSLIAAGSWWVPFTILVITILLVRIHPEPADACCKCFEDGVAFAGVFIGVKFGQWRNPAIHNASIHGAASIPVLLLVFKMAIKIILGMLSYCTIG